MRLFLAVNLPDTTRRAVQDATATLRQSAPSVRWVPADSYHITLKFLGEVPEPRLPELRAALSQVAARSLGFTIALRTIGAFPNFRRPRVFWIGAANAEPLVRVQKGVDEIYAPLGFPTEAREFHPHLTLGRVSTPLSTAEAAAAERAGNTVEYEENVAVRSIELMQSRLSPKGARYEAVYSVQLPGQKV